MKYACAGVLILAVSSFAAAQDGPKTLIVQGAGPGVGISVATAGGGPLGAPVTGAPYSATVTNESVQTLTDGNRIVQTSGGTMARDSQGRTRQDMPVPVIGNLSVANAPHLAFIQDPVAHTMYTLNLTDKTAQTITLPSLPPPTPPGADAAGNATFFFLSSGAAGGGPAPGPLPPPPMAGAMVKGMAREPGQISTEDLGTQTMEGVSVTGMRTTLTIPAGQIGNEQPIVVVTEVWTSPDLGTIVSSKRSDPRVGEQTFRLTNIVRGQPDPSLFTVPADFTTSSGPQDIIYRANPIP